MSMISALRKCLAFREKKRVVETLGRRERKNEKKEGVLLILKVEACGPGFAQ